MDDNVKGSLALVKTGAIFITIGTAEIGDGRAVSICSAVISDVFVGSIGFF